MYCCSAGHEINGHDPIILAMITSRVRIPFLLSHKSGVTKELLDLFVSMVRNGLSFSQIQDIMLERLHVRHLEQESRLLEDLNIYSASHPMVMDSSFPAFSQQQECPSRNTISEFFLHYFDFNENLFIKRMTSTSADEEWLCCDHTFDITGIIGYERREDRKWIRQYNSLFCVMNEKGQIVTLKTSVSFYNNCFGEYPAKEKLLRNFILTTAVTGKRSYKRFWGKSRCKTRYFSCFSAS